MRRCVLKLAVFLLLGAIINVAVAWGCAMSLNPFDWKEGPFGTSARRTSFDAWSCHSNKIAGAEVRMYAQWIGLDLSAALLGEPDNTPWLADCRAPWEAQEQLDDSSHTTFDARGWPLPSLWSRLDLDGSGVRCKYGIETGCFLNANAWAPRCLPMKPIWNRFAFNTGFYAAVMWLVFVIPHVLRRKRRMSRNLCLACGYPIGWSDVCTECGSQVNRRSVEATT